jgi:hypothetical protein
MRFAIRRRYATKSLRFLKPVKFLAEALEPRTYLSLAGLGTQIQAVAGQPLDVGDINGSGAIYVPPGVSLSVDEVQENSLIIGGELVLQPGFSDDSRTSTVGALSLTPQSGTNGTLDITDNQLLIDYGTNPDPQSTILSYLAAGSNGGYWNGSWGIVSSAVGNLAGTYGVGYSDGAAGIDPSLISGQLAVAYTLNGDITLQGLVDGMDFSLFIHNWDRIVTGGWEQGDFTYGGSVNSNDYYMLGGNFGDITDIMPAPDYTIPPQYVATFTDASTTPLSDLSASIDWGDGSTDTPAAIVSDGDGTFHVLANHTFSTAGTFQVTTTITDSDSNSTATVASTAIVAPTMLSATPLDAYDVQLLWPALPILAGGETLQYSTDPTFSTGVTSINLAGSVTDDTISGLTGSTTYYFQLESNITGTPVIATTSATTPASDGNGGTSGPTAPTITQDAIATQPTPTTLSLTMAATSAAGDPISYCWQELSGPGGPPPAFTNSEQTTTVDLSAAGNYEFQCTATDDSDMLSVSSDVPVEVNQTATSITVSPGYATIAPGGTLQLSAVLNDQFGNPTATQPAEFSWGEENTEEPSQGSNLGLADIWGNVFIPYDLGEGVAIVAAYAPGEGSLTGTAGISINSQISDVANGYLDFLDRYGALGVNNAYITLQDVNNFGQSGIQQVPVTVSYDAGASSTTLDIPVNADGTPKQVDLSAYPFVTDVSTVNVGWLYGPYSADPTSPTIVLGNGSSSQVLQASDSGQQNLVPLYLSVPPGLPNGTQVTLSTSAANEVDVWNADGPDNGDSLVLGGQTSQQSWTIGTNTIPTTLYVGATQGSTTVGDIQFTLTISNPGVSGVASATTLPATAVKIKIVAENDPNNAGIQGQNIVGQTNNWLVGQNAILVTDVSAPPAWLTNPTYQWSIPRNALFQYENNGTNAQSVALAPTNLPGGEESATTGTSASQVEFFWVSIQSAAPGPDTDPVSLQVGGIDGSLTFTVSTTFNVYAPTINITPTQGAVNNFQNNTVFAYGPNALGQSGGMNLSTTVGLPALFNGETAYWNYLQTVTFNRSEVTVQGNTLNSPANGKTGLDTTYPYGLSNQTPYTVNAPGAVKAYLTGNQAGPTWDAPQSAINSTLIQSVTDSDSFNTYVMFLAPGAGSEWVPLQYVQWSWSGTDVWNGVQWQIQNPSAPVPKIINSTTEPSWNVNAGALLSEPMQ